VSHRYSRWPATDLSLLIVIVFLACEISLRQVPWYAWFGSLILFISGIVKNKIAFRLILIVTGAAFLGFWCIQDLWIRGIVIALTLWLSLSLASSTALLYLLLPFTLAGILTTVPDTEETGFLLGILIAPMMLAWRLRPSLTTAAGASPLAGLVAWAICCNGQGRPESIFVSIGCLGMLAIFPLLKTLGRTTSSWVLLLLHCLSIVIVLEFARTTPDTSRALFTAFAALAVPGIALLFLSKSSGDIKKS
jgi:hypothetical protein